MNSKVLLFLILILSQACGQTEVASGVLNNPVDLDWARLDSSEYLLSARLNVYNEQAQLMASVAASYTETGLNFPDFSLSTGSTYRFIIVYYAQYEEQGIPFAVLDKWQVVSGTDLSLDWSGISIRYDPLETDEENTFIPDLDLDNDGVSNFTELKDRSSPLDSEDHAIGPGIELLSTEIVNHELFVQILANDEETIQTLRVMNYRCALISEELSEEIVNPETGFKQRQLSFSLDIRKLPNDLDRISNSIFLSVLGSDDVLETHETFELSYPIGNDDTITSMAILRPLGIGQEARNSLNGLQRFELEFCGYEPMPGDELKYNGITGELIFSEDGSFLSRAFVDIDTTQIGSGHKEITVALHRDINAEPQILFSSSDVYQLANSSDIRMINPTSRSWLSHEETLSFRTELPEAKYFQVTVLNHSSENYVLNCEDEKLDQALETNCDFDVSNLPETDNILLKVDLLSPFDVLLSSQTYSFEVKNDPQIHRLFLLNILLEERRARVRYEILNLSDEAEIEINGQPIFCSESGTQDITKICRAEAEVAIQTAQPEVFLQVRDGRSRLQRRRTLSHQVYPRPKIPEFLPLDAESYLSGKAQAYLSDFNLRWQASEYLKDSEQDIVYLLDRIQYGFQHQYFLVNDLIVTDSDFDHEFYGPYYFRVAACLDNGTGDWDTMRCSAFNKGKEIVIIDR